MLHVRWRSLLVRRTHSNTSTGKATHILPRVLYASRRLPSTGQAGNTASNIMTNDTKMLVAFDFDHTVSSSRCASVIAQALLPLLTTGCTAAHGIVRHHYSAAHRVCRLLMATQTPGLSKQHHPATSQKVTAERTPSWMPNGTASAAAVLMLPCGHAEVTCYRLLTLCLPLCRIILQRSGTAMCLGTGRSTWAG
jgi:hypothetical protein